MAERKRYNKPEIKQVKLMPEEAVIAACKAAAVGASKNGTGCTNPSNHCVDGGS
ncbi:MAG: hypothetical protein KAJ66_02150 [Candidatus Omnitrophica bacterium]|nr:hypothetical protein [Candidatus Omnitrophota bacterium]